MLRDRTPIVQMSFEQSARWICLLDSTNRTAGLARCELSIELFELEVGDLTCLACIITLTS